MKKFKRNIRNIISIVLAIAMMATSCVFADSMDVSGRGFINQSGGDSINAYAFPGVTASVPTVIVNQVEIPWCAPAAGYMALYGLGLSGSITGSEDIDKVGTLATAMGTNSGGTNLGVFVNVLNNYAGTGSYTYTYGAYMNYATFRVKVYYSLDDGYIPVILCNTASLPYYNNHSTGHYIAIQSFNSSTDIMTLYDSHNNSSYYGVHNVSAANVYNSITGSSRALVYNQ